MTPQPGQRRFSRRQLLAGLGLLPLVLDFACSGDRAPAAEPPTIRTEIEKAPDVAPAPPPPFIVPEGEERRVLMADTPQQTPLYVFGSGQPGNVLMLLGGVHGNEPGGWLAAARLVEKLRPARGAILILPRANKLAVQAFVRTTPELGDLNRLYPGEPDGLPMARMALEIVQTLREFHVGTVVDMHESWAFYRDRPQNGTAFLGQTVATNPAEPGVSFARAVVEAVNGRTRAPHEEFSFREFPPNRLPEPISQLPLDTSGNPQAAVSGGSRSSLGLPRHIADLVVLLVEMGQQQSLERRIALHVDVAQEVARQIGVVDA